MTRIPTRLASMPWDRPGGLVSAPGSLVLELRLGEAPEAIPSALAVRRREATPASGFGIRRVDRLIDHFSDRVRVQRVFSPATGATFDDLEHGLGLAATFRVDLDPACPVGDLVDGLRGVHEVRSATPRWLCTTPFAQPAALPSAAPDASAAWRSRDLVRSEEALAYEPGDPGVIVAVCDTGVAAGHPELVGRLRQGVDTVQLGTGELSGGLALLGDTSDIDLEPDDEVGHGTSCSAIIGAAGIDLPPGAAGACGLMPVRVLGSAAYPHGRRTGVGALTDIDCGVKRCVDLGAKVLNLSFGVPESALDPDAPLPHLDVVRYALSRGCVLVAASGNSGHTERYIPAAVDGVIAVGAVSDDGVPTSFMTRGEHVALCAPGERVVSATRDGQAMVTGTSFAAPFVTAAAALLVSRAGRRATPLDGSAIRELLAASASPFAPEADGRGCGTGILDIATALAALDATLDGERRAPPRLPPDRPAVPVTHPAPPTPHRS